MNEKIKEIYERLFIFFCFILFILIGVSLLMPSEYRLYAIICIAVIMVAILNTPWLLLDYKNKKAVDFSDYRYCIIALTSKIMKADGVIKECELDKVKTTIRRYYKTEEEFQTAQKKFQEILDNDLILLNQICDNINNNLNYVAKSELIMELLAIAYADDKFLENEKLTIETIVKGLNITPQEYKSIYAIFIMKYQQGYYNEAYPEKTDNYNHNFNETETEKRDKQSNYRKYNGISEEDAYIILGIEKSDSDAEIKKAYRSLAVKCHPDNASSLGYEAIRQATETMKQINVAWDVVKMARGIK